MITEQIANYVWTILRAYAGANEHERDSWLAYAVGREDIPEYRFRGALGFGGKVRLLNGHHENRWHVYYYPEDRNDEREAIKELTNKALADISIGSVAAQEGE